jgi:hypothetical protein
MNVPIRVTLSFSLQKCRKPIEVNLFEHLNLYSSETMEAWYNYFKTGDARYFGKLMNTFLKE